MMTVPPGVKIHLALGFTDMRKSFDGLSMVVQEVLRDDPFSGHLFVFRGRKSDMIRILFWDGNGLCLFSKKLQQGYFVWPSVREAAEGEASERVFLDHYSRSPYKRYQDSDMPLNRMLVRSGSGPLQDMAEVSSVIGAAQPFVISRAYIFRDDRDTEGVVENIIRTSVSGKKR